MNCNANANFSAPNKPSYRGRPFFLYYYLLYYGLSLVLHTYLSTHLYLMGFFSFILQSHSIHGMSEEEAGGRPYKEMGILTYEEKKFLLAVERGDVASTRR